MRKFQIPEVITNVILNLVQEHEEYKIFSYIQSIPLDVCRFIGMNEYLEVNCTKFEIALNDVMRLNDKFDCCAVLPKCISGIKYVFDNKGLDVQLKKCNYHGRIEDIFENLQNENKKKFALASFTDKSNLYNCKMWYYYASNYKGACLVYDLQILVKVLLMEMLKDYSTRLIILPVKYTNKLKENCGTLHSELEILMWKYEWWKDEKEWRIVSTAGKVILHCKPKKIMLGPDIDVEKAEKIEKMCKDKRVQVVRTHFSYSELRIMEKEDLLEPATSARTKKTGHKRK